MDKAFEYYLRKHGSVRLINSIERYNETQKMFERETVSRYDDVTQFHYQRSFGKRLSAEFETLKHQFMLKIASIKK